MIQGPTHGYCLYCVLRGEKERVICLGECEFTAVVHSFSLILVGCLNLVAVWVWGRSLSVDILFYESCCMREGLMECEYIVILFVSLLYLSSEMNM
jgi:hypothetical protein